MSNATTNTPIESLNDFKGPQGKALRWLTEIKLYEEEHKEYWKRCDKIVKRYRNSYGFMEDFTVNTGTSGRRFSLLWANIQTLQPVVFAKPPKADVQRRFKDKDPVARLACEIAERCLDFFIDDEEYIQAIKNARDDYLIVGLGVHWQRYLPHFKNQEYRVGVQANQGPQITDDADDVANEVYYEAEDGEDIANIPVQEDEQGPYIMREERVIDHEEVISEYINWKDFGHSPGARTWAEVYCVWRKAFMTRDELIERFGEEIGKKVQLDYSPQKENETREDNDQFYKKATIYEIWDKSSKKVSWVANSYDGDVLDEKDDPLGLPGFFPCQQPLMANLTTGSLIPVADYVQYQDQALEMDRLTEKIYTIMDAIRVRGLYAGNIPEFVKMLQDGSELDFTPVQQSIVAMANGDLAKCVYVWPIEPLIQAMRELIAARERVKADAYEVTGISDIIRGATDPNETLGAQQLKAQTGAIRIRDRQHDMARFIRDGQRLRFAIIANHFQPETIMQIAGVNNIPEFQFINVQGKWVDPQTIPPEQMQQMQMMNVPRETMGEAAIRLIQDRSDRQFRIDIETDSTVEIDQSTEKAERTEFVQAVSQFVQAWAPILQSAPQTAPLFGSLLQFAVRGFRAGDQLESAIDEFIDQLQQMAKNPPQPQPDPAMIKAEADAKSKQIDAQIKERESQQRGQIIQLEAGARMAEIQAQQKSDQINAQAEERDAAAKMQMATLDLIGKGMDLKAKQKQMNKPDA